MRGMADLFKEFALEEVNAAMKDLADKVAKHGGHLVCGAYFTSTIDQQPQLLVSVVADPLVANSLTSILTDLAMDDMSIVSATAAEWISKVRSGDEEER